MLSLKTRSRSRDLSRPHFHGLGLVGPSLGLVGSGLGLWGPGLGIARSGLASRPRSLQNSALATGVDWQCPTGPGQKKFSPSKIADDLFFAYRSCNSVILACTLLQLRPALAAQIRPAHREHARCPGGPVHL